MPSTNWRRFSFLLCKNLLQRHRAPTVFGVQIICSDRSLIDLESSGTCDISARQVCWKLTFHCMQCVSVPRRGVERRQSEQKGRSIESKIRHTLPDSSLFAPQMPQCPQQRVKKCWCRNLCKLKAWKQHRAGKLWIEIGCASCSFRLDAMFRALVRVGLSQIPLSFFWSRNWSRYKWL